MTNTDCYTCRKCTATLSIMHPPEEEPVCLKYDPILKNEIVEDKEKQEKE